jgi:hypothetical protein
MNDSRSKFGIPDTMPPRTLQDLRGYLWFGGTGLLLCLLVAVSHLPAGQWILAALLGCWALLPAREIMRRRERQAMNVQYRNCVIVVLVFCIGFGIWARCLGLSWVAVLGGMFLVDAFANALAAVTEYWRLSLVGHAIGLAACGFAFPFVDASMLGVLLGIALLLGSSISAAVLYCQVRFTKPGLVAGCA